LPLRGHLNDNTDHDSGRIYIFHLSLGFSLVWERESVCVCVCSGGGGADLCQGGACVAGRSHPPRNRQMPAFSHTCLQARVRGERERGEREERETTGYEPLALHAPLQWATAIEARPGSFKSQVQIPDLAFSFSKSISLRIQVKVFKTL